MHKCLLFNTNPIEFDITEIESGKDFILYDDEFDLSTEILEVSLDVSNCTNTNENIISAGSNIDSFWTGTNMHVYYTKSTNNLLFNLIYNGNKVDISKIMNTTNIIIKLQYDGIYVNDEKVTTTTASSWITAFGELSTIQIGSLEGSTRSNAKYNYIKISRNSKITN